MYGNEFCSQAVESLFDLLHLCSAGEGFAIGIVPKLFLFDSGESFQPALGKDSAINEDSICVCCVLMVGCRIHFVLKNGL